MQRIRTPFPKHLQAMRELMPELLAILENGRKDEWYAFIWLEEIKTIQSTAAKNENTVENCDRGIVFRVVINNIHYEKATNILDEKNLLKLASDFKNELEQLPSLKTPVIYTPKSWSAEDMSTLGFDIKQQLVKEVTATSQIHFSPLVEQNPLETNILDLKKKAQSMRTELLAQAKKNVTKNPAFKELMDVISMVRQQLTTHIFVDREKNMSQTLPVTLLYSMGMSESGHTARCISGGLGGLEIATHTAQDQEEVTLRTLQLENARKLKPGRYKIITGPDVTGVIAHEAFGHTQEGDTWMKARSIAQDLYHNKTSVGNNQASIINHPNLFSMEEHSYGTNGSYFFDHEGQLARPQVILDQGRLRPPMTDLASAIRLDMPRTANGKRESFRRPLMTRQTNTYFTAGDKTLEELMAMVDNGFLARWASGGMEDPKGGSLTAGTSYLEEIKDGKLTGEIYLGPSGGHVELTDPVFTLLEKIIAKSKSIHEKKIPENKFGGCGKYHKELVQAGCGGPYILWENINCG